MAADNEKSVQTLRKRFGDRVIAYDSLRHQSGRAAGYGPMNGLVPNYIANDRNAAARNGEEAVIEYMLLSRCNHLVHNGSGLARTVLLANPSIPHTNTHLNRYILVPTLRYLHGKLQSFRKWRRNTNPVRIGSQ